MAAERSGSCACGKITVTVKGEPEHQVLCHCTTCQKTTGSLCAASTIWPKEVSCSAAAVPERLPPAVGYVWSTLNTR